MSDQNDPYIPQQRVDNFQEGGDPTIDPWWYDYIHRGRTMVPSDAAQAGAAFGEAVGTTPYGEKAQQDWQRRSAFDISGTKGFQDYSWGMNAGDQTGAQQSALSQELYNKMRGIGMSPAMQQYMDGVRQAQMEQRAIGASTRGMGGVASARAGAEASNQLAADSVGQLAQIRAAEQIQARKQYADMLIQMRAAELTRTGMGANQAQLIAENEMAQRAMNDQMSQAALNNEVGYYTMKNQGMTDTQAQNYGQARSDYNVNKLEEQTKFDAGDAAISIGSNVAKGGAYALGQDAQNKGKSQYNGDAQRQYDGFDPNFDPWKKGG